MSVRKRFQRSSSRVIVSIAVLAASIAGAFADVKYTVEVRPVDGVLHVTMQIPGTANGCMLQIPNWGPGGYRLNDNYIHVQHLAATGPDGKALKIDKEVIVVESNSTDGTRDIVKRYERTPGIRVVYEDAPRGKGHAVRTGLAHVTGTIILIQDADFEYDIDDYDALLEPILQHKATFVLGSRSLGLDDWKVRKYDSTPIKGLALNFMQVVFAKTYDVLYQQHVTDVNTMYKVFRADCLDGLNLESDGFDLDIELACKLARNGNSPMEVPVNYVARGFDQGKKIRFWRDGFPSYAAFFKYRFK